MPNRSARSIERLHASRNYKLVPAAMQMGYQPMPSNSKAARLNRQRKAKRDGRMVHVSATYGEVDIGGTKIMGRTGGLGTLARGHNRDKRMRRSKLRAAGQRCKGRRS